MMTSIVLLGFYGILLLSEYQNEFELKYPTTTHCYAMEHFYGANKYDNLPFKKLETKQEFKDYYAAAKEDKKRT